MNRPRIPIKLARNIALDWDQDQVIIVTYDRRRNRSHVVTYGTTLQNSADAAAQGNKIKTALGWPAVLCTSIPARLKRRLKDHAEISTIRHAILSQMWTKDGVCRHCGCKDSADGVGKVIGNPHEVTCSGMNALRILEDLT